MNSASNREVVTPRLSINGDVQSSTPLLKKPEDEDNSTIHSSVLFTYYCTFSNMLATQCINPVLLLYLKHRGWVTEDNVTFFGVVTAVGSLVPVVFNPLSGWWSARRGVKDVMLWGSLMSIVGIGVIAEVDSRYAFVVGYALVFFLQSLRRTVHQSYISAHTTPKQRLRAMSWAPLGTSLGAVVGSGLVLLCDYGPNPSESLVWKHMELNTYTLAFACALLATLIKVIAICVGFKPLDRGPQAKAREPLWEGVVKGRDEHGTIHTFDSHSHVRFCLVFFSIVMFVMNLSVGFYMVSLHPLLVNRFHFGQTDMARVSMVYCALAIVPPLVMAAISKKVSSRTVLIAGMTLKLSGCLLFSLPAVLGASHHLQLWTLVVAYVFILKGAIFVVTAALTLFSQLVGKRNSATYMGIVTSCFAMGTAVGNIVGGNTVVNLYGSWAYVDLSAGAAFALLLIVFPPFYRRLDFTSPRVQLLNNP